MINFSQNKVEYMLSIYGGVLASLAIIWMVLYKIWAIKIFLSFTMLLLTLGLVCCSIGFFSLTKKKIEQEEGIIHKFNKKEL